MKRSERLKPSWASTGAGSLRLDISPCAEDVRYCLSPELARLHPYPDEKGRPTKEMLEFPLKEVLRPDYVYRNLLYVYPCSLNFAGRPGSARNIACRVQLMCGEEETTCALPVSRRRSGSRMGDDVKQV